MPPAVLIAALPAAIAGGTSIVGAKMQSGANKRAATIQAKADADALAFQREQEARRQQEYDREESEKKRQWDAEQQFEREKYAAQEDERLYARRLLEEREARMAPRRAASQAALLKMGDLLGINFGSGVRAPNVAPAGAALRQTPSAMTMARLLPQREPDAAAQAMPATEASYAPVLSMNRLMPRAARRY